MSRECIEWGEETRQECAEYRDNGYNECSEYRDNGYNSCASWRSECCDWWPCSWLCEIVSWFCVAWYWVSNIVCVSWYWVSNVVCVAWTYITTAVCLVWEVIVTIVIFVVAVIEAIVGTIISFIDFIIEVILSIPIIGRLIREILSIIQEIIYRIIGLVDALAWALGIRPEKKLRMCVIIMRDERGLVADPAMVIEEVQAAADIFRSQANVRLIPCALANIKTPFHDDDSAGNEYIHEMDSASRDDLLDISCGAGAWWEDLWLEGSAYNMIMTRSCFCGNARRLLGYGSPVTVFVVRSIDGGNTTGCSLGPLTDYITVVGTETTDKTTIAHESGHACGLWHVGGTTNLMFGTDSNLRRDMSNFQAINFRNSRHVTYL
ncbi:MAG: hypothetical protein GY839_10485 [candidate division Zixibacteria bacterium]|nr:hypothetical protein [candidate division Zixibacteria bacterium]